MVTALLGQKIEQSQAFLLDGTRVPVTKVRVSDNRVVMRKTVEKDGYVAVQLGIGTKKHPNKPLVGHIKGAKMEIAPLLLQEVGLDTNNQDQMPAVGDTIRVVDVFRPGDIIDVTGVSKGKGFAGVVKRHHFKGGPRTHGQSDRERAPGSIGQTTTPGRVYRGKRMAGHMGTDTVTVKNLRVVTISGDTLFVKGLIPGGSNTFVVVKKVGEDKKFVGISQPEVKEETKTEEKT